ncbi:threonylcarbamoyl-AMP synthase, partial [Candidatus Falkowbacteria bacterium]|nr:threonylcarbamoyl-AMP synthase [Candidatus Falkowbacteria bacterium]
MEKIKINFKDTSKKDIEQIADFLKKGKTIAYPTDTVYGLGCLATNKKAIKKVFQIKKRDKSKALLVLVKSWCMLKKYFKVSAGEERILRSFWPGPVSVLLRSKGLLPKELAPGKAK